MPTRGGRPTKLAADAMLGSLARKLRAIGFDSAYYKDMADSEILAICKRQKRVLVTADRRLATQARGLGLPSLLVSGETDGRRLSTMVRIARESRIALRRGDARCSICNGELKLITRAEAVGLVPDSVARRHKTFHRCPNCGQLYWKGGHWKKLRRLERLLLAKS